MWHHHFEFLLLGYGAYMTFFAFCKKAFPEISDQTIARMVAGMEAEIFRPDDELRRLARVAVQLGVEAPFQDGVSAEHDAREPARTWVRRERSGWRSWRPRDIPGST